MEIQAGNPPGARSTNVLGQWFILDGKIYPCPTVYDVMATRLVSYESLSDVYHFSDQGSLRG